MPKAIKPEVKTLIIDNFTGSMSDIKNGDLNSGLADVVVSVGFDPFGKPKRLQWSETPIQIDAAGSVITDLIVCGKTRLESGILYVYAVGHTGRVYKIQVNDPITYNPNYDKPVLLTTLAINSPTFTKGGFIDFFGSTSRIYIGHDMGVTQLNFDGTGEAFVGVLGSWTQSVPRPLSQFIGTLCVGNGSNIAIIDSTLTVTSYSKLSPSLPGNYEIRDLDINPDGNYLQILATSLPLSSILLTTPNTSLLPPGDSINALWNGSDMGITATKFYPNVVMSANVMFGNIQYLFGYDLYGGCIYTPEEKFISSLTNSAFSESPNPNTVISYGGLVSWVTPYYFAGALEQALSFYGTMGAQGMPPGWYCPLGTRATGTETDINRIPCQILVSNLAFGASYNGYAHNQVGSAKVYYSTIETSSTTTKYKLYKWTPAPSGLGSTAGTQQFQTYQTQTQLFSKKIHVKEVRVYGEPWVTNNSFQIDLVGADGLNPIAGGSYVFTVGTNITAGDDMAQYNPAHKPTYALALSITNLGTKNHVINKVEIDYVPAGK